MAAWQNQSTIVELLLLNGASVSLRTPLLQTSIFLPCLSFIHLSVFLCFSVSVSLSLSLSLSLCLSLSVSLSVLCVNYSRYLQATSTNTRGNTALHYACEHCPPGKTLTIIKLLQVSLCRLDTASQHGLYQLASKKYCLRGRNLQLVKLFIYIQRMVTSTSKIDKKLCSIASLFHSSDALLCFDVSSGEMNVILWATYQL